MMNIDFMLMQSTGLELPISSHTLHKVSFCFTYQNHLGLHSSFEPFLLILNFLLIADPVNVSCFLSQFQTFSLIAPLSIYKQF